jgi:aminocarboxymuconate-semialdehyde decarboxylase
VLPKSWPDFAARHGGEDWPWMRPIDGRAPGYGAIPGREEASSRAMLMQGQQDFRPVISPCWDIAERLDDMDRDDIDHQIISATPILFQWHRPAEAALDVARHFNDQLLEMCAESPTGRLSALCQVPLQDVDLACEEASRAASAGHVGVQIGNHDGPRDLDQRELLTFLGHCADEQIPVLVHPWDMMDSEDRLSRFMMKWTVGMPAETQLSIAAMILGGGFDVLEREDPEERLKICFAHGGGSFSFLLGRLENAYLHRDIARGKASRPPSAYVERFSCDSAVFDERSLRCLVDVMGVERVMLGSDYPFPLGEQRVGSLVRGAEFLSQADKDAILGGNAREFFNLSV